LTHYKFSVKIVANATVVYATNKGEFMSTVTLINSIHNCQMMFRKATLPLSDLTGRQHSFIYAVCEKPGRTQDSIAQEHHLDKSTVARVLSKLETNGYVKRISNPKDNRELLIYPTKKTLEVFPKVKQVAKEWARLLNKNISEEERQVFNSVLKRMYENAIDAVSDVKD